MTPERIDELREWPILWSKCILEAADAQVAPEYLLHERLCEALDALESAQRERDESVKMLGRIGEVTWNAGLSSGDRDQMLKNVQTMARAEAEGARLRAALEGGVPLLRAARGNIGEMVDAVTGALPDPLHNAAKELMIAISKQERALASSPLSALAAKVVEAARESTRSHRSGYGACGDEARCGLCDAVAALERAEKGES